MAGLSAGIYLQRAGIEMKYTSLDQGRRHCAAWFRHGYALTVYTLDVEREKRHDQKYIQRVER
jgi:thioredoxin reductase